MKTRGGYSVRYPKASYEIDFDQDVSLFDLPADDDWILNANYIDKTFMRHKLSYDLFRKMNPDHEASQSVYVELELNGSYHGLYVLMEKLDVSSLDINKNDSASFIFKEPSLFRHQAYVTPQDTANYYQQISPDIADRDLADSLRLIRKLLMSYDKSDFQQLQTIFDLSNIIDWHLLLLISNAGDGFLKNFYLYKINAQTGIRVAPWDFDHSFGRDGDGEYNFDRLIDLDKSLLFSNLVKEEHYRLQLKNRWNFLVQNNVLSVKSILDMVENYRSQLLPLVEKNFIRWPHDADDYYDNDDFQKEVQLMKKFIILRHAQVSEYMNSI
ncbi:CotH kinase family protein [Portibacter marinus]|uniref:CotH kinase family protein n=1 Tax=Portibacter marinus TaxID=2898660 RepID=UPI001F3EB4A2|nr:CotH kinase family protein [Portibacter marinus]